jgi:flavodoxin short chain
MKTTVIYWSGTGNTAAMAEEIYAGAKESGSDVTIAEVVRTTAKNALMADAIALGCPAMGAEVLEETEMEPFVATLESIGLTGKRLILFGSYDWGDGEWMRVWQDRMIKTGAVLIHDGVISKGVPGDNMKIMLQGLGAELAKESV